MLKLCNRQNICRIVFLSSSSLSSYWTAFITQCILLWMFLLLFLCCVTTGLKETLFLYFLPCSPTSPFSLFTQLFATFLVLFISWLFLLLCSLFSVPSVPPHHFLSFFLPSIHPLFRCLFKNVLSELIPSWLSLSLHSGLWLQPLSDVTLVNSHKKFSRKYFLCKLIIHHPDFMYTGVCFPPQRQPIIQ